MATMTFSRRSSSSSLGPVADSPVVSRFGERAGFGADFGRAARSPSIISETFTEDTQQSVPFSWMRDGGKTGLESKDAAASLTGLRNLSTSRLDSPIAEVGWDTASPSKQPSPSWNQTSSFAPVSGKFRASSLTGGLPSAMHTGSSSRRSSSVHFADQQPRLEHRPSVVTSPAGHITDWSLFLASEGSNPGFKPKETGTGKATTFSSSYTLPIDTRSYDRKRSTSEPREGSVTHYSSSVSLPYDPKAGPSVWETTETVISSDSSTRRPSSVSRTFVHTTPPTDLSPSPALVEAKERISSISSFEPKERIPSLTSSFVPKVPSLTSERVPSLSSFDVKEQVPSISSLDVKEKFPSITSQLKERFPGLTSYETKERIPSYSSFEQKEAIPSFSSYTPHERIPSLSSYSPAKDRVPSISSQQSITRHKVVEEDWSVFRDSEANQPSPLRQNNQFTTETHETTENFSTISPTRQPTHSWSVHSVRRTSRQI